MAENNEVNKDVRLKNLEKGTWKPGQSGNPNGRPKGRRNFETIYYAALEKLAELNGKTAEELEDEIVQNAIATARKGNYQFYKDNMDRLHGKPQERIDHTTGGKSFNDYSELTEDELRQITSEGRTGEEGVGEA